LVSLSNTGEPLYLVNRGGNRPSHEQAADYLDKAIDLCKRGGFARIALRGDTDFSQTTQLDRWNAAGNIRGSCGEIGGSSGGMPTYSWA